MAAENMKSAAKLKQTTPVAEILASYPEEGIIESVLVKATNPEQLSEDDAFLVCPQLNEQSHSQLEYEDDKDFESLSEDEMDQVATDAAVESEQISPQIVVEQDLNRTEDSIVQSPISEDAQRPHVMQAPKQLTQNSNRNFNGSIQNRTDRQSQHGNISSFSKCPEPQAPPAQISHSPIPNFKQHALKKQTHKSSYKVEKSQQIRKSYTRFVAANHNLGANSQRPSQPPLTVPIGIADGQVYSLPTSVQSMTGIGQVPNNGRRIYGKGTKGVRSKTVKPSLEQQAAFSQLKPTVGQATNMHSNANLVVGGNPKAKQVDLLVIGSGPAALGLMVAAIKQQRFTELIQDDGVAILDDGTSFGGGMLCNYGINSNTSANSFLKCIFRKAKDKNPLSLHQGTKVTDAKTVAQQAVLAKNNLIAAASKDTSAKGVKRRQKSVCKERVNQHQPKVASELAVKLRNRQMSPVASSTLAAPQQKGKNNRNATSQPPVKFDSTKLVSLVKQEETQPLDPPQKVQEADLGSPLLQTQPHVGQPQEPDAILEATAVQATPLEESGQQSNVAQDPPVISSSAEPSSTTTQKKQAPQLTRKKSREEPSQPRILLAKKTSAIQVKSAEKSLVSLNRTQSRTATNVKNATALKAVQNPLAVQNVSVAQGPAPKSLTMQLKARQGDAEKEKKEWTAEDVLTPFKDIFPSNISVLFRKLSKEIIPLSLVGHLLNYVGNHLLHYAYQSTNKRIYYPMHKALSIHLMGNGDIVTQVLKTEFTIIADPTTTPPSFNVVEGQQTVVHFRSKALVIAGGAIQGVDRRVENEWFPDLAPEKVIPSDSFLKKQVYLETIEKLRGIQNRSPKVVIIGGSHSGFSCAWLLVNGPAMYQRCFKKLTKEDQKATKVPFASRKQIKNCIPCCTCGNAVLIANAKLAAQKESGNMQNQRFLEDLRSQSKVGSRAPRGLSIAARELSPVAKIQNSRQLSKTIKQKKDLASLKQDPCSNILLSPDPKQVAGKTTELAEVQETTNCSCLCKCFGFFKYNEWPSLDSESNKLELPTFGEASIKILYRENIKVFYKSAKQAEADGYSEFDANQRQQLKKKDGYLYSFTGLRGDAKQLYSNVINGKERRIQFVKAGTAELQRPYVEEADIVIWACGYQTNAIKIYDLNKKELVLSQKVPNTQFDVDGKNRVMLADGNVLNKVFACGVGFPVRTKDGGVGNIDPSKNPRADSFSLYMHTVGELLLKSLLPKRKMATILSHKETANPYLKAATYEQIKKDKERKNKKLSLKELQTKKEKGTSVTKLSQLINPNGFRMPLAKGLIIPDQQHDQATPLQKEMTDVYLSYHRKNGQSNGQLSQIHRQRNGPLNLNTDLEGLSSFDPIYSMASRSNCFSQRTGQDELKVPYEAIFQNTGYTEMKGSDKVVSPKGANPITVYGNVEFENQELAFKLPEIRAELTNTVDSKQLTAKLVDNKKCLTQLSFTDITIANQPVAESVPNQLRIEEESEPELNERDSTNVLSSASLIQSQKQGIAPDNNPSQKSLERIMTSTSRNNQNMASQMPSKSPLLLQKKQQMVIQKTREPVMPNSYAPSQIATMSNLKPAQGTSATVKSSHKMKKSQVQKRQQTLVDQPSPYLHFGVPTQIPDKKVSTVSQPQKTGSKRKNAKESALAGTQKEIITPIVSHKTQSVPSTLQIQQPKTAHLSKQSTMTGSNHRHHAKDVIASTIHQTQKAFSEREQNLGVQFSQYNIQSGIGLTSKKSKKDQTSVDLTDKSHALKFSQVILEQNSHHPMTSNLNTKNELKPLKSGEFETDTIQHATTQENVYSVKSLITNTKLFPPISNKQTTEIIATEWANNSLQNSHGKRKPSAKINHTDSLQSLALSAQVSVHGQPKKSVKDSQSLFSRQSEDSSAKLNNSNHASETHHQHTRGKILNGYLKSSQKNQGGVTVGSGQIGTKSDRKNSYAQPMVKRQHQEQDPDDRNTFVQKITDETNSGQMKNFEAAKQAVLITDGEIQDRSSVLLAQKADYDQKYTNDTFIMETNLTVREELDGDSHQVPSETEIPSSQDRELRASVLDKSNISAQLNSSKSAVLRLSSELHPQKSGDVDQLKNKYLSQAQPTQKLQPKTDSLVKKFESVINDKNGKFIGEGSGNVDLHKTKTPSRVASKKFEQSSYIQKGRPRIGEMSAVASARRTGAASAIDVQSNSYAGTGVSALQNSQSAQKRVTANKKPLSSVGLIEKIINGKEICPLQPDSSSQQPSQPSHHHQNSLTSVKQMTRKIAQTIQSSNNSGNNRMSLRQRQVAESQNAKFKQLAHMPANEKSGKGREKADEKVTKSHMKPATISAKQGIQASPQAFSITAGGKVPPETPGAELKSTVPMVGQKLQSNQSLGFIRSNQQASFFVHKTINDLSIKADNDFIKDEIRREKSTEDLQESVFHASKGNRINGKKEVHSKATHISPVLKNRGSSKPVSSTKHIGLHSSSNPASNNAGKHKSPLKTTVKSAISSNFKEKSSSVTTANIKSQTGTSGLRSPKAVHRNYINSGSVHQQTEVIQRITDQSQQQKRLLSGSRGPTRISSSASQSALSVHATQATRKDQLTSSGRNQFKVKNTQI